MKTTLRLSAIATMFLSTFFLNADAQSRRTDQDKNIIENNIQNKQSGGGRTEFGRREEYRYNYNSGYAEFFLRIPVSGVKFTVSLGDQSISNSNGLYRFFDVPTQSRVNINIRRNGIELFRGSVMLQNGYRYVVDYDGEYQQLYILNQAPLNSLNYSDNSFWNNFWNNYYTPGNNHYNPNYNPDYNHDHNHSQNNDYYLPTMSPSEFSKFLGVVNRSSFDSDKAKIIKNQGANNAFSVAQIKTLLKELSFDSDRLSVAKALYATCADPNRYYMLNDAFSFSSSANELMEYTQNYR